MPELQIRYVPIDTLNPAIRNARTHPKKQIRKIAKSIEAFGFLNPILCDRTGRIVAGHGRLEGAKLIGMATLPVIYVDDLTPDELRAFAIAENRLSELGGFSTEILTLELTELAKLDLDVDLTVTGFDTAEIDLFLSDPDHDGAADDLAAAPPSRALPAISWVGDIWDIQRDDCWAWVWLSCCNRLIRPANLADIIEYDARWAVKISYYRTWWWRGCSGSVGLGLFLRSGCCCGLRQSS